MDRIDTQVKEYKEWHIEKFKNWVLGYYKHPWHTLADNTLLEALDTYNKIYHKVISKFWC
jgi:hypothetical protein